MAISATTREERSQLWRALPDPEQPASLGFEEIGAHGGPGREAAENSGRDGDEQRKDSDPGVDGDGVDAGHGLGEEGQDATQGSRGGGQPEEASGETEQEPFADALGEDDAGARSQGETHGMLAAAAEGADEEEDRDVRAGDEQDDAHAEEEGAQQRTDTGDDGLAQGQDVAADVDGSHVGGEVAHDLPGDAIGIVRGLLQGDAIAEASDEVSAPGVVGSKLGGGEAHGHPELGLADAAGCRGNSKLRGMTPTMV